MNTEEKLKLDDYIIEGYRYGGLLGVCCLCGNDTPIHKYGFDHGLDNENYLTFNGKQFLCLKCAN